MAQSEGYKTKQRDHILQFLIENQSRHVTVDDVVDHPEILLEKPLCTDTWISW